MHKLQNCLEKIGTWASWSALILVVLVTVDVLLRYLFGRSFIWLVELEVYFFAILFLLGAAYCYQYDMHVRVDIFYDQKSKKQKAWINILGNLFLLLPWAVVILIFSYDYALSSLKINEASAQPNGLPAVWILKSTMFIGFLLLTIQSLIFLSKQYEIITSKPKDS